MNSGHTSYCLRHAHRQRWREHPRYLPIRNEAEMRHDAGAQIPFITIVATGTDDPCRMNLAGRLGDRVSHPCASPAAAASVRCW